MITCFLSALLPPHPALAPESMPPIHFAVLTHGKNTSTPESTSSSTAPSFEAPPAIDIPEGMVAAQAPMQGMVVSLAVAIGNVVQAGYQLGIEVGDTIFAGHPLVIIQEQDLEVTAESDDDQVDLDAIRPDLAETHHRHAATLDDARPEAVARRRRTDQRTARENVDDLCDPGTFVEHGSLVLTPGTGVPPKETIYKFPTDGMVTGIGSIRSMLRLRTKLKPWP